MIDSLSSEDLIDGQVEKALGGSTYDSHIVPRPTYDGDKMDVHGDFVVLWKRPSKTPGEQKWGTHRGCIRFDKERDAFRAVLFWGHYGMTVKTALQDFAARKGSIR
jgi:hypothetical protein